MIRFHVQIKIDDHDDDDHDDDYKSEIHYDGNGLAGQF